MAELLKGKEVADAIKAKIIKETEEYKSKGIQPTLAILRAGAQEEDLAYENRILKNCQEIGFAVKVVVTDRDVTTEEFAAELEKLNEDESVHGILVFRPLPKQIDEDYICKMIKPEKDIDCMNPKNLQKVFIGDQTGIAPCTPEAVIDILNHYRYNLTGKNVVIVNRSLVLGKPLVMLFLNENATVTVCHSKTVDLPSITSKADIFVSGIGSPKFFGESYVSKKTVIIDVGINFDQGKMCGDLDFERVEPIVKAITPVPGGIGVVTTAILLRHVLKSVELCLSKY